MTQMSQNAHYQEKDLIFSVENLEFTYPGASSKILKNVNLALYAGECLGLAGANGSGKTTLFRCITGLLKPQKGIIRSGNRILASESDFHDLRCKVGYVLQQAEDQLFFPSVQEDLAFGPLNIGLSQREAEDRAREALDLVGLSGFGDKISWNLSGGEKKLVALAAILAMRPAALLLDEPLNELDDRASARVKKIISRLPCAKIVISHDRQFLQSIAQRELRLENGRLTEG